MLCLGPKKSLSSPRLELPAQGIAYQCSKVECEDHSAIQAPLITIDSYSNVKSPNLITLALGHLTACPTLN